MQNCSPDFWNNFEAMELKYIESLNRINVNHHREKQAKDIEKRKLANEKRHLKNQLRQKKVNQKR